METTYTMHGSLHREIAFCYGYARLPPLNVLQIVSRQTINVPRTSHKSKSTSSLDSISECASVLIPFREYKLQTNIFSLSDNFAHLFSFCIIFISHFQLFFSFFCSNDFLEKFCKSTFWSEICRKFKFNFFKSGLE